MKSLKFRRSYLRIIGTGKDTRISQSQTGKGVPAKKSPKVKKGK